MKGLKIRVPESEIYASTWDAVGANPSIVAGAELMTAMSQGTIDGMEVPLISFLSGFSADYVTDITLTNHMYSAYNLLIGDVVWSQLTDEEKGWLQEAADYATNLEREELKKAAAANIQEIKDAGYAVAELEDREKWVEACQGIYEKYEEELGSVVDMAIEAVNE